jgi:hypothetical protein
MKWKTEEIEHLLKPFAKSIKRSGQGGDYDTNNLCLKASGAGKDEFIFVYGFVTGRAAVTTPDDTNVEMVAVCDGQSSDGGLSSSDEPTAILYAKVCVALRKAGFCVVRTMKEYR